jgi:hypothetical protein
MARKQRDYDVQRKKQTERTLKDGIEALRRTAKYRDGKPISVWALSKHTGIARQTIEKHQVVMDLLAKMVAPPMDAKSAKVNVDRIHTLEQAIATIKQMETLYNDLADKYNNALRANEDLNLQVVRLEDDLVETEKALQQRSRG